MKRRDVGPRCVSSGRVAETRERGFHRTPTALITRGRCAAEMPGPSRDRVRSSAAKRATLTLVFSAMASRRAASFARCLEPRAVRLSATPPRLRARRGPGRIKRRRADVRRVGTGRSVVSGRADMPGGRRSQISHLTAIRLKHRPAPTFLGQLRRSSALNDSAISSKSARAQLRPVRVGPILRLPTARRARQLRSKGRSRFGPGPRRSAEEIESCLYGLWALLMALVHPSCTHAGGLRSFEEVLGRTVRIPVADPHSGSKCMCQTIREGRALGSGGRARLPDSSRMESNIISRVTSDVVVNPCAAENGRTSVADAREWSGSRTPARLGTPDSK